MKLIIFNGGSCSGKSTIIKNIMQQKDHYFHLSYDALKWSFSNYQSAKHYQDVQKNVLAVAASVFGMGYNVLSDSSLYRDSREKLIDLAVKAGYEILEINLEADFEVLSKRFAERLEGVRLNSGHRITNVSADRFRELFDIFQREKNPEAITFRTDIQSVEEISADIMKLL